MRRCAAAARGSSKVLGARLRGVGGRLRVSAAGRAPRGPSDPIPRGAGRTVPRHATPPRGAVVILSTGRGAARSPRPHVASRWWARFAASAPRDPPPPAPRRVYLFVFLPNPANCRKRNFGRNFANSERKENSNSKNEISVNSDRNFGDFDRNFGDFDRKMMSVVIFVLFPRSNEKLLNTNFVQFFEIYNFCFRNFSFEQWFESYLIILKTTN